MSETPALPDPLTAAIDRALVAAQAATDAAHEAEAALHARAQVAAGIDRASRRMGWLAGVTAGAALIVLAAGTVLWLRSSADLRQTAELHAATGAAFVERLAEMNAALDRMDAAVDTAAAQSSALERSLADAFAGLESRISTQLQTVAQAMTAEDPLRTELTRLREDLLAAIAEVDLSLNRTLAAGGNAGALDAVLKRLSDAADRLSAGPVPAAAPAVAPRAAAPRPGANPPRPAARPAAAANPFRFP